MASLARFSYLEPYQVLLCLDCGICLPPGRPAQQRHLRQPPHCLRGQRLKALVDAFAGYTVDPPGKVAVAYPPGLAIAGLACYQGFACCLCPCGPPPPTPASPAAATGTAGPTRFLTRSKDLVQRHISRAHGTPPARQLEGVHWRPCLVQTFFAETRFIRYFAIDPAAAPATPPTSQSRSRARLARRRAKQATRAQQQQQVDEGGGGGRPGSGPEGELGGKRKGLRPSTVG